MRGIFDRGETRTELKRIGKGPSESDKLTTDVVGATRMSMQSFTKLVGIGSTSGERRTSSSVAPS